MAVDYGEKKTGLAACDKTEFLAAPIGILTEKSMAKTAEKIVYAAKEYDVRMIVIGLPIRDDDTEHQNAKTVYRLGEILNNISGLPVEYMEEDNTSIEALEILKHNKKHGKKRQAAEDAVAAALILERFLEKRRGNE